MTEIFDETATVEDISSAAKGHFRLNVKAPLIAHHARPGQFVNVLCQNLLLRRPFSVHRRERPYMNALNVRHGKATARDAEVGERFGILFKVVGEGTRWLSLRKPGDELKILGPLGRGFEIPSRLSTAILVGGGCGAAPLYALAEELRLRGVDTYAFIGAEDEATLPVRLDARQTELPFAASGDATCLRALDLEEIGVQTALTTVRGERGFRGLVTDMLQLFLSTIEEGTGEEIVAYASGTWGMLKKVAQMLKPRGISCQVLLEEMMGCGIGVCMSCVIKTVSPDGDLEHKRVCVDGPMFHADEVYWDAK